MSIVGDMRAEVLHPNVVQLDERLCEWLHIGLLWSVGRNGSLSKGKAVCGLLTVTKLWMQCFHRSRV